MAKQPAIMVERIPVKAEKLILKGKRRLLREKETD